MYENKIKNILSCLRNKNCDFSSIPPQILAKVKDAVESRSIADLKQLIDDIKHFDEEKKEQILEECLNAVNGLNDDDQNIMLNNFVETAAGLGGRRYRRRRRTRKGLRKGKGKKRIIKSRRIRGGEGEEGIIIGLVVMVVGLLLAYLNPPLVPASNEETQREYINSIRHGSNRRD